MNQPIPVWCRRLHILLATLAALFLLAVLLGPLILVQLVEDVLPLGEIMATNDYQEELILAVAVNIGYWAMVWVVSGYLKNRGASPSGRTRSMTYFRVSSTKSEDAPPPGSA